MEKDFDTVVFTQLDVLDYNKRRDGKHIDAFDFYNHPKQYQSNFMPYAQVSDLYIAAHFYGAGAPYIFTREDAKNEKFNIQVVADVSCDIDGPVASTLRSSTIEDPIYGYDPLTEKETDFREENSITVMAVDNLPCELPKDASEGFSENFSKYIIPALFNKDPENILNRAQITALGKLTANYSYLQDYVNGNL